MALDSPMFDNIYFDCIDYGKKYCIKCYICKGVRTSVIFDAYGRFTDDSKCVIYPKGKTTWEGFVPQSEFKDGDVVVSTLGSIAIIKANICNDGFETYCGLFQNDLCKGIIIIPIRLATEEEKEKLFGAFKAKGYKWNEEKKTLEKLTKDKFDINALKPFDKVLVRVCDGCRWYGDFYMWYDCTKKNFPYHCACGAWGQCIPFEGNQHLLGKQDDCNDFYKTWE